MQPLTRQHFELVARAIRETDMPADARLRLAEYLCRELTQANPRFDALRFVAACEPKPQPQPQPQAAPEPAAPPAGLGLTLDEYFAAHDFLPLGAVLSFLGQPYILAQTNPGLVNLIGLVSGNRLTDETSFDHRRGVGRASLLCLVRDSAEWRVETTSLCKT